MNVLRMEYTYMYKCIWTDLYVSLRRPYLWDVLSLTHNNLSSKACFKLCISVTSNSMQTSSSNVFVNLHWIQHERNVAFETGPVLTHKELTEKYCARFLQCCSFITNLGRARWRICAPLPPKRKGQRVKWYDHFQKGIIGDCKLCSCNSLVQKKVQLNDISKTFKRRNPRPVQFAVVITCTSRSYQRKRAIVINECPVMHQKLLVFYDIIWAKFVTPDRGQLVSDVITIWEA